MTSFFKFGKEKKKNDFLSYMKKNLTLKIEADANDYLIYERIIYLISSASISIVVSLGLLIN